MQKRNTALLDWYRRERRPFPWRGETDPYRILVSEVMLQQTRAARVVPFYERFVARFPTAEALAAANLGDVLSEWSGLGYNARALRLREAAAVVTERGWPTDPDGLMELPGVGPYTAAAVASFAFGMSVPAVDTNMRRVLGRWLGEPLDGTALAGAAEENLGEPAAEWNQAVMELGAAPCTPKRPDCARCPVASWCSDPDVYESPPRRGRFEGSARQLRGTIVRTLVARPGTVTGIAGRIGFPRREVRRALQRLADEGMVVAESDTYRISD